MAQERPALFECAKLFEVQDSTPGTGGENLSHTFDSQSSIGIELCSWRECSGHNALVLICNNGYIILYVMPAHGRPIIKQLKWFETRQQHILDITLDPHGEWLVCACLNGGVYIVPVISLTLECAPKYKLGALNDVTVVQPTRKIASPTCIVWWESMKGQQFCITGSEVGEVTFFDLKARAVATIIYISGCVDSLLLAHHADSATHLLIGQRGGEWKRMLLEEHYHEAAGVSYDDDFDVVPDDMVIKTFLDYPESTPPFDVKDFSIFSSFTHITTQDWREQHLLSSLHLSTNKLKLYSYDFELTSTPLQSYQLLPGATAALVTDRLLFVVSHNDTINPSSFTLSLMSTQRALVSELDSQDQLEQALVQQFTIPSPPDLIGFFNTARDSPTLPTDLTPPPTHLGGCIVVTKTTVYQCRQRLSPDSIFLDLALSPKFQEKAEEFGITLKLDICGLYRIAAQRRLNEQNVSHALKLFQLSRCSAQDIINSFARLRKVPELVQFLHQAVYDDTGHASIANTKQAQNILFQCFLHECLRLHGTPEGSAMLDKFSQFITDKFLYDQSVAMESLLKCGLKEQLFELAKAHNKLQEVLDLMVEQGSMDLSPTVQASLASRQYISTVNEAADGLYLYQMLPSTFVRFLTTKPSIIPCHLGHLSTLLPKLDIPTLIRLANLFDPSHPTIRPLLISAHASRHRSLSTSSLVSVTDSLNSGGRREEEEEREPGPRLEAYIEMFLSILTVLNRRRRQKPVEGLMRLSPLSSEGGQAALESYSGGSQWMRGSILSCGLHHAAMVVNGNLYTWGSTKNGKLGHGDIEEEQRSMPLRVETFLMLNVHVISVSCGAEHTIALCQEGIYSWGSSSHGQLGHGDTLKRTRPVQISSLADKGIVSVECGQYHSLALSDDHRVWSWGWGVHGQLGLQSVDEKMLPTHAALLDPWNVSFIAAGYGHSAVLTAEGKVLTFGNGMYGQLGHGNTEKQSSPKPVKAVEGSTVYLLACGNFHTVAVATDQKVFYWGKNLQRVRPSASVQGLKEYKRSRQAHSSPPSVNNTHTPQPFSGLDLDDTVVQVGCGSFHSLILTAKGTVYSWGSNVHGQLGHPHNAEMQQPKEVDHFEGHKIVAIVAGDEFSIVVDDRGHPWGWGRAEQGQLGFESKSSRGGPESVKQSVFTPSVIDTLTQLPETTRHSREVSPDDAPFLDIDLEWDLPDFATVGSPHFPYGCQALDTALVQLHGFYRTSFVLWQCQDWEDWESMATVYTQEEQWPQALEYSLKALTLRGTATATSVEAIMQVLDTNLEKLVSEAKTYHSSDFVHNGLQLLNVLLYHWESHGLPISELEAVLIKKLSVLSYPLSLITRSSKKFSFKFQLEVAKEVIEQISKGAPKPEDLISTSTLKESPEIKQSETISKEGLLSDSRLWAEVLRNLSKDIQKCSSFSITGPALEQDMTTDSHAIGGRGGANAVAFSCGHSFSETHFELNVLPEFTEQVQNFPIPIPNTLHHLNTCYRKLERYPSACPYCVFQHLRKLQLQECPGVPTYQTMEPVVYKYSLYIILHPVLFKGRVNGCLVVKINRYSIKENTMRQRCCGFEEKKIELLIHGCGLCSCMVIINSVSSAIV